MSGPGPFGAFRRHGLGADGWPQLGGGRRTIEAEDIAFAITSRPRMGWQTIARIRGVNEADLRKACERSGAIPPPPEPPPEPAPVAEAAPPCKSIPTETEAHVLRALAAGDTLQEEIAARLFITPDYARKLVSRLHIKGLACPAPRPDRGYRLTPAGRVALEAAGHG